MSSYTFKAKRKSTGEQINFTAHDNYFANREYGYKAEGGSKCYTQKDFDELFEVIEEKIVKKITIDIDGWVSLDDGGNGEIGLGDIDVDVVIDDRRVGNPTKKGLIGVLKDEACREDPLTKAGGKAVFCLHNTIEEHVQCPVCAQRACDATSKDMEV